MSVNGKTEAEYSHLNFEIPLTIATALSKHNPNMTFVYVSGAGTDGTEKGKTMWARVKGKLLGILKFIFPEHILSTDIIGKAMLEVARHGTSKAVLEPPDLYKLVQEKDKAIKT